jgi:hypothetical protein
MRGEAHVVEVLLDRLERESSVLNDFGLVTGAFEELEGDFLVDDVCERRGASQMRRKKGRKQEGRRTVLSEKNLERRISAALRRYPVARLKGGKESVRHILSIGGRFHAVGDSEVEAVLREGRGVSCTLGDKEEERERTLRLS